MDAKTSDDEYDLPESTLAAIRANVARMAAKPMPDHLVLAVARIWNSVNEK